MEPQGSPFFSKRRFLIGIIVLALLAAGAGFAWKHRRPAVTTAEVQRTAPTGVALAGVPPEFFVVRDMAITKSEHVLFDTPTGKEDHYTLEYSTSMPLKEVADAYVTQLAEHSYTLFQSSISVSKAVLSARNDKGTLGLSLRVASGSPLTLVYIVWSQPI